MITVLHHTIILAINYMAYLHLPSAFSWGGNCIENLKISYQNRVHEVYKSRAHLKDY